MNSTSRVRIYPLQLFEERAFSLSRDPFPQLLTRGLRTAGLCNQSPGKRFDIETGASGNNNRFAANDYPLDRLLCLLSILAGAEVLIRVHHVDEMMGYPGLFFRCGLG